MSANASVKRERNRLSPNRYSEGCVVVPIAGGRSIEVCPEDHGAVLTIRGRGEQQLSLEIRFEMGGPVVKVSAAALEIEGVDEVSAECETFTVNASKRIELSSAGTIEQTAEEEMRLKGRSMKLDASPGALCAKANDELQLLGEMILLNCDRPMQSPQWIERNRGDSVQVAAGNTSGDDGVVRYLLERK